MKKKTKMKKTSDDDLRKKIAELASTLDKKTLAIWASDCAEHVLSYFEEKHPNDNRPRKAIEAVRAWINGEGSVIEARSASSAAHAAARSTKDDLSLAAARAAGQAAATAHAAGHAIHTANYAAKIKSEERIWQYERLFELRDNIEE